MSLAEEYKDYCNKFNNVWKYLQSCSKDIDTIVEEVCQHRKYYGSFEKWKNILSEVGISYVSAETCDYGKFKDDVFKDLALFSDEGYFLMNERYILPVKDMMGNVIALIGWYPDSKKYITTPSKFFSKDCLFFGMEQLGKTGLNKDYFLVEGIFDSLSIRALGFNSVAQMGIDTSRIKISLYGLFRRIVGIPDNDKQGRKVLKGDKWSLPMNASYLRWTGGFDGNESNIEGTGEEVDEEKIEIKDIDKLCSLFEDDSVRGMLQECLVRKNRIIKVEI